MAILNKYIEIDDEQELNYKIPSVFKTNKSDMSLTKSIVISSAIHPLSVFLVWLFIFVAGLLGISFVLFNKPEAKVQDIEFVLVDKEDKPINPNTRFRSDKNSRAGGKHDPKRKVSLPKTGGSAQKAKTPSQPQKQAQQPAKKPAQKSQGQKTKETKKVSSPAQNKQNTKSTEGSPAKVQAQTPAPRPSVTPSAPKVTDKPKSNLVIPTPKTNIPNLGSPAGTGPVAAPLGTGNGTGNKSGGGTGLSFAPTGGSGTANGKSSSSGSGSGSKAGYGSGSGNVGNPGPGNPNGRPGIDAIKEPDFGPYMRDLQQRIKRNWEPPKGEESRRVVILFTISKDGRLLSKKITKSSGLASADKAAMSAVELSAPFKPLPVDYKENSVDIQFTFDYNVFSARKY